MSSGRERSREVSKCLTVVLPVLVLLAVGAVVLFVLNRDGSGRQAAATTAAYRDLGVRLDRAAGSIERALVASRMPLSAPKLEALGLESIAGSGAEAERTVGFRVKGVIRTSGAPLVLINDGLFKLGDVVEGFRIVSIQDDRVTFVDEQGNRQTVTLYRTEQRAQP